MRDGMKRVWERTLAIVLVLAAAGAVGSTTVAIDRDIRAIRKARAYAYVLGQSTIPIMVDSFGRNGEIPASIRVAHVTRRPDREGCVIHVREEAIERSEVIAHETCHCVMDYEWLGEFGYGGATEHPPHPGSRWMSAKEMELRAQACEAWLTDPDPFVDQDRRAGRMPAWWYGR
jgi:hypothetical protein